MNNLRKSNSYYKIHILKYFIYSELTITFKSERDAKLAGHIISQVISSLSNDF